MGPTWRKIAFLVRLASLLTFSNASLVLLQNKNSHNPCSLENVENYRALTDRDQDSSRDRTNKKKKENKLNTDAKPSFL